MAFFSISMEAPRNPSQCKELDLKINVITHELDSPYIENHCTGVSWVLLHS